LAFLEEEMKILVLFTMIMGMNAFAWDAKTEFTQNCATCHSIGGGDKIGPDLAGLSERRSEEWLIKYIKYPIGMMQGDEEEPGYEKPDPIAKALWETYKPNMMAEQELEDDQIKKLIAYIKAESKGKSPKGKIVEFQKKHGKKK
jgi:mono/diheme cytochrome c family protein